MTSFLDLAKSRHSVRHYENKPVETGKLKAILEAGRIAPTAANQQQCRFLVLSETKDLKKLQKHVRLTAPLWLLLFVQTKQPFGYALLIRQHGGY